jgi:ABC-2 type transport system permease protein
MRSVVALLAVRNRTLILATAALFAVFEIFIAAAVKTLDLDSLLQEVLSAAPPFFSSMFGEQFGGLTVRGILAFGWNHPVVLAAGAAVAIVLGARAVAGEIDQGAIELLMTQPVSRARYYAAHAMFGAGAIAILTLAGVAGTIAGQRIYGLEPFGARDLALLATMYWLLNLAWFGIALAVSARGREGGAAATVVFFIALASYLVNAIGSLLDSFAFALPYSLYSWYSPREILVEAASQAVPATVLAATALSGLLAGAVILGRRDLP